MFKFVTSVFTNQLVSLLVLSIVTVLNYLDTSIIFTIVIV